MVDGYLAEDEPGLREDITRGLMRRFESVREGAARNQKKFEQSGCKTYAEYMKRPMPVVTLRDLQRAEWDSQEYKDITISFFKKRPCLTGIRRGRKSDSSRKERHATSGRF